MMELLTVAETAALLKTTKQQVRKMIAQHLIPALKVGVNGALTGTIWKVFCKAKWNSHNDLNTPFPKSISEIFSHILGFINYSL